MGHGKSLDARTPIVRLRVARQRLGELDQRLREAMGRRLRAPSQQLNNLRETLHALSPLATLQRGYAIARRRPDGAILRRAGDASVGETVEVLLGQGRLDCEIKAVSALNSMINSLPKG
jgi:exodeoxyribonuclease VII large subunit